MPRVEGSVPSGRKGGGDQETQKPVSVLVGFEFPNTHVHAKKCLTVSQQEAPGMGCLYSKARTSRPRGAGQEARPRPLVPLSTS